MKKIGSNKEVLDYLDKNKLWILDSSIVQINMIKDGYYVNVEITLKLVRVEKLLKLQFEKVEHFDFSGYTTAMFQEVAFCKFFIAGDTVYLSLDPYDEEEVIDERDNDCVKASIVNAFISE